MAKELLSIDSHICFYTTNHLKRLLFFLQFLLTPGVGWAQMGGYPGALTGALVMVVKVAIWQLGQESFGGLCWLIPDDIFPL